LLALPPPTSGGYPFRTPPCETIFISLDRLIVPGLVKKYVSTYGYF